MKITIITVGSRGDVEPYLALGTGLKRAGEDVRLATHSIFEPLIREQGVDFAAVEGNIQRLVETGSVQDVLETGRNSIRFSRSFVKAAEPLIRQMVIDMEAACEGSDLIILGGLGYYGGYEVAVKRNIPFLQAVLQPILPTRAFQSVFFPPAPPWLPLKGVYNLLTHKLFSQIFWYFVRGPVNLVRKSLLDMPPAPFFVPYGRLYRQKIPVLLGYSPSVLPKPEDWGSWVDITGYWFLDPPPGWSPRQEIIDFLAAGPPPVYIGFGSMRNRDPEGTTALVIQALAETKQRGILLTGWSGLQEVRLPDSILQVSDVPHGWLFPQMSAVVHHGGAGTTAAGLRAGVPSITTPFFGDQFFWGQRVEDLGVGPPLVPRKQLTSGRLAGAIRTALDDEGIRANARVLGNQIRAENGIDRAVQHIQAYAQKILPGKRTLRR